MVVYKQGGATYKKKKAIVKLPVMKPAQAAHMVDKNARTVAKVLQLLESTQGANMAALDPEGHVSKKIEKLNARINRRLVKLAKWSDTSIEDRMPAMPQTNLQLRSSGAYSNTSYASGSSSYQSQTTAVRPVPTTTMRVTSVQEYREKFGGGGFGGSQSGSSLMSQMAQNLDMKQATDSVLQTIKTDMAGTSAQ